MGAHHITAVDRLRLVVSEDDAVTVRAASGDVRLVLALLDALPHCPCGALATLETDGAQRDPYTCDAHHTHHEVRGFGSCCTDLPHADAVRALGADR